MGAGIPWNKIHLALVSCAFVAAQIKGLSDPASAERMACIALGCAWVAVSLAYDLGKEKAATRGNLRGEDCTGQRPEQREIAPHGEGL